MAMAAPKAVRIELSASERAELEARLRRRKVARGDAQRAEIVLLAAEGLSNLAITERLGVARMTVATWRGRFAERRLDGLLDEPRPGAPRTVTDEKVSEVVTATLETLPTGRTHWSSRGMAKASGLAPSTVQRLWKAFSLQPHRSETFKLSTDPLFVEKVRDIVGLYLSPPERALVLCVDEKSQIQALDRTQPLLPLRPGQVERRTHDYKRHGTTSLFAALDVKAGTIIGSCMPRHRAAEFRRFLDTVEASVPRELEVHVVMDNASSHKTRLIRNWFAKRPRWHEHYTPTSASWINQSSGSSPCSPMTRSGEALIAPRRSWKPPSKPTSTPIMPSPSRSAGQKPPMTSSPPSSASASVQPRFRASAWELQSRDTSVAVHSLGSNTMYPEAVEAA